MAQGYDITFMRLALDQARAGIERGQQPFGACLMYDGKVITCLYNTVMETGDVTAHPEIQAVREACRSLHTRDLAGGVLYATCEPCAMCFTAAHFANVTTIIFGARLADAQRFGFGRFPVPNTVMKELGKSAIEVVGDFLREESVALMQLWADRQSSPG